MTMATENGDWCLIESDPGVFTELIRGFGCTGIQVEELWCLDEETLAALKPVHGLIFLFKWKAGEEPDGSIVRDNRLDEIFFAKQVINNACATQAILSILLNTSHEDVNLGETLTSFRDFSKQFDPALKGLSISNSDPIKKVHNSFARQQMFEFDNSMKEEDKDSFHFVAYMPINGRLYELDGLKPGPVDLGSTEDDWLRVCQPIIQRRIQKYSSEEIHFNLMAVVSDRKMVYTKQREEYLKNKSGLKDGDANLTSINNKIAEVDNLIAREEEKRRTFKVENIRRQHNYLPFIVELLKILARKGELNEITEKAKTLTKSRDAARKERKDREKMMDVE